MNPPAPYIVNGVENVASFSGVGYEMRWPCMFKQQRWTTRVCLRRVNLPAPRDRALASVAWGRVGPQRPSLHGGGVSCLLDVLLSLSLDDPRATGNTNQTRSICSSIRRAPAGYPQSIRRVSAWHLARRSRPRPRRPRAGAAFSSACVSALDAAGAAVFSTAAPRVGLPTLIHDPCCCFSVWS